MQVHIYLWYIGHQTVCFRDVGDRFDITISSVSRIINRITMFLSNLSPTIITWPNENEKQIIEEHFRGKGFHNVIGAIDGSHTRIDRPRHDPESYINRKSYSSIQVFTNSSNTLILIPKNIFSSRCRLCVTIK